MTNTKQVAFLLSLALILIIVDKHKLSTMAMEVEEGME